MTGLSENPKPLSLIDNLLSEPSGINAKDPATAPTVPGHGSILSPSKDQKMNTTTHTTGATGAPEAPSKVKWTKVGDVMDILATVRHLNEALFLAASGLGDMHHTNAFQSVLDEINNKLLVADDRLDEIKEELA